LTSRGLGGSAIISGRVSLAVAATGAEIELLLLLLPPPRLKKAPSDCCGRPRPVGLVDDESVASSLAPALGP
jgi:hypothetical protein